MTATTAAATTATEQAQRAAVVAEALTWLGTRYHHHARIKGQGVDCLQLLIAVYTAAAGVRVPDPGFYPRDWHLHRSEERYMQGLLQHAGRRRAGDAPQPGDIGLFKFGRCHSHSAIFIGPDELVHAYLGRGVVRSRLGEDPLAGRPFQLWNPWAARPAREEA